jgi:hypothetical protein
MYVKQSLTLWRLIMLRMTRLWAVADADMLSPDNPHSLRNTGQGLNRLQRAPGVSREMQDVLSKAFALFQGRWIGSSAVHLGDINVPNALVFIDKYSQVERILGPFVKTVGGLEEIILSFDAAAAERQWRADAAAAGTPLPPVDREEEAAGLFRDPLYGIHATAPGAPGVELPPQGRGGRVWPSLVYTPERARQVLSGWVRTFYNLDKGADVKRLKTVREYVVSDFFKHAFDGSGADDYGSAGSCIDGRLTSAWNWCSKLSAKSYYVLFLVTGFVGFEGEWTD